MSFTLPSSTSTLVGQYIHRVLPVERVPGKIVIEPFSFEAGALLRGVRTITGETCTEETAITPTALFSDELTIAFRAYRINDSHSIVVAFKNNEETNYIGISTTTNGKLSIDAYDDTGNFWGKEFSYVLPCGEFKTIQVTYNRNTTTVALYIDGSLVESATDPTYIVNFFSTYELRFRFSLRYAGLDWIAIYNSELSPDALRTRYLFPQLKPTDETSTLVLCYKFDEDDGYEYFKNALMEADPPPADNWIMKSSNLERVTFDETYNLGHSLLLATADIGNPSKFSLQMPIEVPDDITACLCVSYLDENDEVVRYKLIEGVGEHLNDVPLYNGEPLPVGAQLEVWSVVNERIAALTEEISLYTSYRFKVDKSDTASVADAVTLASLTPTGVLCMSYEYSFPLTFDSTRTF